MSWIRKRRVRRALNGCALSISISISILGASREVRAGNANADVAAEAERLFKEGQAAFDAKRLSDAEQAFANAWQLQKSYDIAANLGFVELKLKKHRAAAEHLAYAVEHSPPTDSVEARKVVRDALAAARSQVGTITLRVEPSAARVFVDGRAAAPSEHSREVFVEPGTHTVEVSLDGFAAVQRVVRTSSGEVVDLTLQLARTAPGSSEQRLSVPIVATGSALAIAALGAGIGLRVAASGKESSAVDGTKALEATRGPQPCRGQFTGDTACQKIQNSLEASGTLRNVSTAMFASAGAFATATVVYVLVVRPKASSAPAGGLSIAPVVAPGQAGFSTRVNF